MALAIVPAMAMAQAAPAAKPTEKAAAKPAMQHDMSKMGADTGMKHDMAGMKHDMSAMGKEKGMGEGEMNMHTGWKEFDALHAQLMAITSASKKGDLKPARAKGAELGTAADAWLASKGPASCDNATARKGMPAAVADLSAIGVTAKGQGNDAALKAAIDKAHESFRAVAQPCMKANMKGMKGMHDMKDMQKPDSMKGMKGMNHAPATKKP